MFPVKNKYTYTKICQSVTLFLVIVVIGCYAAH